MSTNGAPSPEGVPRSTNRGPSSQGSPRPISRKKVLWLAISAAWSLYACAYFIHNIWVKLQPAPPPYRSFMIDADPAQRDACAQGDAGACYAMGLKIVQNDRNYGAGWEAQQIFLQACDAGVGEACATAALGRAVDARSQLALFDQACELNSRAGCYEASNHYREGRGTDKDEARANARMRKGFALAKRECELGQQSSCGDVAAGYEAGIVVEHDAKLAALYALKERCSGPLGECESLLPELAEKIHGVDGGAAEATRRP